MSDYLRGHQCDSSPCGYLSLVDAQDIELEERATKPLSLINSAGSVLPTESEQIERGRQLVASGAEIISNLDMSDVRKYLRWERPWDDFERRFVEWVENGCPLSGENYE